MLDEVPTRVCYKCKEPKPLTLEFFYPRRTENRTYPFTNICRQCVLNRPKKRLPVPHGHRRCGKCKVAKPLNENFFNRSKETFGHLCRPCDSARRKTPEMGKLKREYQKSHYDSAARFRQKARQALHYAIKVGRLERGKFCQICFIPVEAEAHHYLGYAREHWFDVVWMCSRCHKFFDRQPAIPAETLP
jgi:hypothetical protein